MLYCCCIVIKTTGYKSFLHKSFDPINSSVFFLFNYTFLSVFLQEAEPKPEVDGASCDVAIPPCDTGCTESMLGLPNIASKRDPWQLLKVTT